MKRGTVVRNIVIGLAFVGMLAFAGTAQAVMDLGYIPGVTVVKTWAAVPGETAQWDDWTDWDGGNSIDAAGNKMLGTPPDGTRGAIYINDTRTGDLAVLSYNNSGVAMSYTLGTGDAADSAVYLEMFTFDGDLGDDSDMQRLGFIIASNPDGTNPRTIQQFRDGEYRYEYWAGSADLSGTHTMALVLEDMGVAGEVDVVSYLDGVEMNRFSAVDPLGDLTKLGVGYEFTGNQYARRGTLVSEVTAFTVPEPATMSLLVLGGLAVLRRRRK